MSSNNGGGPCGACKFLRRKCVKGCVFAPFFDSEHGSAHFAAVHKVFGASNASKILVGLPANNRLDAVVTLCYEALARVRDPVYGCVGHIFTLQQQILNLQVEVAYIRARLSTIKSFSLLPPQPHEAPSMANILQFPTAHMASATCNESMHFDPSTSMELLGSFDALDRELIIEEEEEECDHRTLAPEFESR